MQSSHSDDKIPSVTTPSFTIKPLSPKLRAKEFESPPPRRFPRPSEDSQISTSSDSSNASSRNSLGHWHDTKEEDTKYPMLLHVKTLKTRSATQSFKETDIMDAPVAEEGEEQEMENQFLKKLPVIADGQEFNSKRTHSNRFRDGVFSTDLSRCRSLEASFLPLDSVQEDKNEEDINAFKQRRKLRLYSLKMEDLNEFNQNNQSDRTPHDRRERRNMSMQMGEEVIVEEQENKVLPHLQPVFGSYTSLSGSRRGSGLISSPGTKLRVDEIDFLGPKFEGKEDDSDENDIDPIIEETEEKNGQTEENKEFQVAKAKMNEEREFMKKVIKGEEIDEIDSALSRRNTERELLYLASQVAEEIIEEDNNENIGN